MDTQIILDMDGVVANFVKGALRIHGLAMTSEEFYENHLGNWWLPDIMEAYIDDFTAEKFWAPMDQDFWSNLEPMPDAMEIITFLENRYGQKNIMLWSSPSQNLGCIPGKILWIEKHLPKYYHSTYSRTFGSRKYFAAKRHTILVDDHDKNCEEFFNHSGHACLVPRPWNRDHPNRNKVIPRIEFNLDTIDLLIKEGH